MIHVLDRQQDKIIATFDKGQVYRAQFRADNQLLMALELEVPLLDSRVKYLAKRERLIIEDESGTLQELLIFETDTDTVAGIKYVYCHAAYVDIGKSKVIDPVTLTGQTATTAATFVVNGTRYKVGRVEGTGFRTYTVEKPSNPYQQLLAIATLFGLKLRFRIEVAGNLVTGRYVDLLERLGRDNGKEVVFGKDLMGLRRREDSSRIVTALKCYGPEQSDGTRLTVIVTDDDARQRWSTDGNHLWDIYEPQSEDADMTLARLTQLGEAELKKRIDSVVEYDVEHYDMSHIPEFAHEAAYLHDTIRVKDEQYEPALYLQAEIIEVEYDLFDRSTKKSKLGQFIEYDAEDILKQVQAYIAKNAARIVRIDVPPDGRDNLIWVDTSQDPEVAHTWNGTDWVAARGTKGDTGPQGLPGPKGEDGIAHIGASPPGNPAVDSAWFETDGSDKVIAIKKWTGSLWVTNPLDAETMSVNSLSALSANLGTILAGHIEGVTLNLAGGKFIVDAFGNVTFKGNLDGASGTFSGSVLIGNLNSISGGTSIIGNEVKSGIRYEYGSPAYFERNEVALHDGRIEFFYEDTVELFGSLNAVIGPYAGGLLIEVGDGTGGLYLGGNVSIGQLLSAMNGILSEGNIRLSGDSTIIAKDRPWFAPTLLNGVSNLGSGYSGAAYTKEVTGRIRLKGFLQGSADNRVLFTLPVGFRPSERRVFICFSNHSTGRARVDIETNGSVTAVSSGNWVVLDGIEFPI